MREVKKTLIAAVIATVAMTMYAEWPRFHNGHNSRGRRPDKRMSVKIIQRELTFSKDLLRLLRTNNVSCRAVEYQVVATYPSGKTSKYGFGADRLTDGKVLSSPDLPDSIGETVAEYEMTLEDFLSAKEKMEDFMKQPRQLIRVGNAVSMEEVNKIVQEYNTICQQYVNQQIDVFNSMSSVVNVQNVQNNTPVKGEDSQPIIDDRFDRMTDRLNNSIEDSSAGFKEAIESGFDRIVSSIGDAFASLKETIGSGIEKLINSVKDAIDDLFKKIVKTIEDFINKKEVQQFLNVVFFILAFILAIIILLPIFLIIL